MKSIIAVSLTVVVLALASFSVRADNITNAPAATSATDITNSAATLSTAPEADPWQFGVTPGLWAVQVGGKVNTRGLSANVGVSFDQIINHLEGVPVMLNVEVRKKKFGFYTTPLYVKLAADFNNAGPVPVIGGNDTLTLWVVDTGAFYQIYKTDWEKPLTLDVMGGIRYWNFENDISVTRLGSQFSHSRTANLWDPFIGLRLKQYLTEKLSYTLTGEYGGFAISESTPNDSWLASGYLSYDFNKWFTLMAGYRALGINTYNKTGNGDIKANLVFQGAVVGFGFKF